MRDVARSREELLKEMERLRTHLEELERSAGKVEGTIPAPQESIEEYRLLFECSGVGALVIEEDMSISLVNKEFERLSGYTQDEIQREKNWTPLVSPESLERMKEILGGNETVLLVDDEQTIVEVMEKALFLTGYKVLVARGGKEAVEVFKKNHDRIDLVILDMIMPGMGGGKVFDLLRAIHPGVKVILSSGYSIDGEASQILARGCSGFIQKPFGIKELSQKIREVMERT